MARLQGRLAELKDAEENARRLVAYDAAAAERDKLAAELRDLYPGFVEKLADLLTRIVENDRTVEYINSRLPKGAGRLLVAELVARGLTGFVKNGFDVRRVATCYLPSWRQWGPCWRKG